MVSVLLFIFNCVKKKKEKNCFFLFSAFSLKTFPIFNQWVSIAVFGYRIYKTERFWPSTLTYIWCCARERARTRDQRLRLPQKQFFCWLLFIHVFHMCRVFSFTFFFFYFYFNFSSLLVTTTTALFLSAMKCMYWTTTKVCVRVCVLCFGV